MNSLPPTALVIVSAALVNSALIMGMVLLTLVLGIRRRLNQLFAVLLCFHLFGNALGVIVWLQALLGIELSPDEQGLFGRLVAIALVCAIYVTFLFTRELASGAPWSRLAVLLLGLAGLLTSVVIVAGPINIGQGAETIFRIVTLGPTALLTLSYILACSAGCGVLLWQARDKHLQPWLVAGLGLTILGSLLLLIPNMQGRGLTLIIETVASILITVAIVRLQVINPLEQDRQRVAEDRDRLVRVHEAVQQMLGETDLSARMQIVARTLHILGWGRVTVALRQDNLTIVEPPEYPQPLPVWPEELLVNPKAPFYLKKELPVDGTWIKGDKLFVPLAISSGQVVGLISLENPADQRRPSDARVRPLGILTAQSRSVIENSQLLDDLTALTQELQNQIEELTMMQRVDQELSATLNFDNVMMLTMDWALRRTGAMAGMLNMITQDETGLFPVVTLGYPLDAVAYDAHHPLPISSGVVGRAVRTGAAQIVNDVAKDADYISLIKDTRSEVAIPMEMRGRVIGVINLESDEIGTFNDGQISFIKRLASRAAVALDNARLYREAEQRADEMAALYSAGRAISASLERTEVLTHSAQSLASVLSVSGAILADYRADRGQLIVTAVYRLGTARDATDILPTVGEVIELEPLPTLHKAVRSQRVITVQNVDPALEPGLKALMDTRRFRSLLVAPLAVPDQILGVAMVVEGRRVRLFTQDEILMAESLVSQIASALRQAKLYEDVRELENLKSEMIRMASHDLRNPLGNAMGYLELLISELGSTFNTAQEEYIDNIRYSTNAMKSLLEDLLTLERVESERQAAWIQLDFAQLVRQVVEAQRSSAALKGQALSLEMGEADWRVFGSTTQLRQAVTNLVGNSIKYTPDSGKVQVRVKHEGKRIRFEVQDDGYGISKERQARLFQRFYRAREERTENIPGTGLGLSLVKTVIERHGGEVSVQSELNVGSTFGFWLPIPDKAPPQVVSIEQAEKLPDVTIPKRQM